MIQWVTAGPKFYNDFREMFIKQNYPERDLAVELEIEQGTVLIETVMLKIVDSWGQSEVQNQANGVETNLG